MPCFSLVVSFEGVGQMVAQFSAADPYRAVGQFLKTNCIRAMTADAVDWPTDFTLKDIFIFIPLDGLKNAYVCGLGIKGKYININIFQTTRRSAVGERYCGLQRKVVKLR